MTAGTPTPPVPRLALGVLEACNALGVSHELWHEYIAHDIRTVRVGRRKLIAITELQRWLDDHGQLVLDDKGSST